MQTEKLQQYNYEFSDLASLMPFGNQDEVTLFMYNKPSASDIKRKADSISPNFLNLYLILQST